MWTWGWHTIATNVKRRRARTSIVKLTSTPY
ncbi:hypothetical protein NQ318_022429 [Aromia moschata]|uniref:Uncharacterized protein n=1 Tax=Aromia moschata TaxID=1265417 RepID=A0AAV8Z6R0_9CUCU|nr:hypothetical protein NQ318_022429 [Aromia moschata]